MSDALMGKLMGLTEVKLEGNPVGFGSNPAGFPY